METQNRRDRHRSGIALPLVALALLPLIGIFGLAATMGEMALMDHKLQDYVDARAIAAVKDRFGGYTEFIEIAEFLPRQTANAAPAACGRWDHGVRYLAPGCPRPDGPPGFLVQHQITHDLAFGAFSRAVGGPDQVTLSAYAIAFIPSRWIMLVQDRSGSLLDIEPSKNALHALLNTVAIQSLPGDHMGLVSFESEARVEAPLTELLGSLAIGGAIDGLELGNLTCTEGGIRLGIEQFQPIQPEHEVYPLMIVVTDGTPSATCSDGAGSDPEAEALEASEEACDLGIDVWSIFVDGNGGDADDARELACDPESFREASNEAEVTGLITEILTTAIPVRLVQ